MKEYSNIDLQRYCDDEMFFHWWKELIEITLTLKKGGLLDRYYVRAFFVHLYELMISGQDYAQYAKSWNAKDVRYTQFELLCKMISEEITEDEFFMIHYYRNCACHIHLSHYSWLNNKKELRSEENTKKFHKKDGTEYRLSQNEVMEIVKRVIGKYGLGEDLFKSNLFKRLSPLILKENPFVDE